MAEDENKAESGEFRPTLTDTLYSSLKLPENEGRAAAMLLLLEELLTVLVKSNALSGEELGAILDRVRERIRAGWENTRRGAYEAGKEKGYPQSYTDEIIDRFTKSAEGSLSGIRNRLTNKSSQ